MSHATHADVRVVQVQSGGAPDVGARLPGDIQVVLDAPEVGVALDVGPERCAGQAGGTAVVALEEHPDADEEEQQDRRLP